VYVVWREGDRDKTDITMRKSTDFGATFESTINLSNNSALSSSDPDIATLSKTGQLAVVWSEGVNASGTANVDDDDAEDTSEIRYLASSNSGETFTRSGNVSSNPASSSAVQLQIALSQDGSAYVAWSNGMEDKREILLSKLEANSSNKFSESVSLSKNIPDSSSLDPKIDIAENGELNVVWNNEKISGAASTAAIDRIKEQNITAVDSTITNLQPTIAFKKIATGTNGTYTTALLALSPTSTPTTSTTSAITTGTTPTPTPTQIQTQADTDTEDTSPESDDNGESNDDDVEQ
jgi:hypothetical protein